MRAAVTVIAAHWRGVVTRRYAKRYRAAVAVTRKFIIGFMNRNKPKCEKNIYVRQQQIVYYDIYMLNSYIRIECIVIMVFPSKAQ